MSYESRFSRNGKLKIVLSWPIYIFEQKYNQFLLLRFVFTYSFHTISINFTNYLHIGVVFICNTLLHKPSKNLKKITFLRCDTK